MAVTKLLVRLVKVCDRQKIKIAPGSELSPLGILQAENSVWCVLPVSNPKLILSIDNAPDSSALGFCCQQCDDCLTVFVEHPTTSHHRMSQMRESIELLHPGDQLLASGPRKDKSEEKSCKLSITFYDLPKETRFLKVNCWHRASSLVRR